MEVCCFYFSDTKMELQAQTLISSACSCSEQCSKLYEKIQSLLILGDTILQKICEGKLEAKMRRGEKLENRLFRLCKEANISLHQLQMLGHEQTFAELRAKNCSGTQKVRSKVICFNSQKMKSKDNCSGNQTVRSKVICSRSQKVK